MSAPEQQQQPTSTNNNNNTSTTTTTQEVAEPLVANNGNLNSVTSSPEMQGPSNSERSVPPTPAPSLANDNFLEQANNSDMKTPSPVDQGNVAAESNDNNNNNNEAQQESTNSFSAASPTPLAAPNNTPASAQNTPAVAQQQQQQQETTKNDVAKTISAENENPNTPSKNLATSEPEPTKPAQPQQANEEATTTTATASAATKPEKSRSPPSNRVDYPLGVPTANHGHLNQQALNNSNNSVSPPSTQNSPTNYHQQRQQQPVGRSQNVAAENNNNNNSAAAATSSSSSSSPNSSPTRYQQQQQPQGNNNNHGNNNTAASTASTTGATVYRDASPSIASPHQASNQQQAASPMSIPYNLQRKVPPSVTLPHCHPHHLEKSLLFPDLVLNDDFWKDVLAELKSHDIPQGGQLSFTEEEVGKWYAGKVCPSGFEQSEWDLLVKNFDFQERPNGVFDSASFKDVLADIGAPCTIAMSTHIIMNLRCLESGRIRCETALFALRAVQRVIARRHVAADLADQVHQKRIHNKLPGLNFTGLMGGGNNNSQNTSQGASRTHTPRDTTATTPRNNNTTTNEPKTPRSVDAASKSGLNKDGTPIAKQPVNALDKELTFMVHPGVHRAVVTPVSPPRSARTHNNTQQQQQQQHEGSIATDRQSSVNNTNNSVTTPRSPSRSTASGLLYGAPALGSRSETPKDGRKLITDDVSGVMSRSPHRRTLKVAAQQRAREKQRIEAEEKQRKLEDMEDAKRAKYGMKPRARSTSRDPSERAGSVMTNYNNNYGNNNNTPRRAGSVMSNQTGMTMNTNTNLSSSSNGGGGRGGSVQMQQPGTPKASLPTGEAHAVLMRARQQRADGADNFLNAKARNGLISEKPSVERGAVLTADKTQMLWNSETASPVVTVTRTAKLGAPTPLKGVFQQTNRSGSMSPDRQQLGSSGSVLASPHSHPNVVLSPNGTIDRRPRHWR